MSDGDVMTSAAREPASLEGDRSKVTRRDILALAALGIVAGAPGAAIAAGPDGQLTWGVHVSLAPTWFDPAETPGIITPFMVMYALHDAMLKPMPGKPMAPCLAESWSASEDASPTNSSCARTSSSTTAIR
jgi:peptide/nickel transport system substrate-binding protein